MLAADAALADEAGAASTAIGETAARTASRVARIRLPHEGRGTRAHSAASTRSSVSRRGTREGCHVWVKLGEKRSSILRLIPRRGRRGLPTPPETRVGRTGRSARQVVAECGFSRFNGLKSEAAPGRRRIAATG